MGIKEKIVRTYKQQGVKGVVKKALKKTHTQATEPILDVYSFVLDAEHAPYSKEEYAQHKNDEAKLLNWVIPEPGIGSGGHINIFRFVSMLEGNGFHSRVYILPSPNFSKNQALTEFVHTYFPDVDKRIEWFYNTEQMTFAHGTVATSWQTAYSVRRFDNTVSKFYFVQDYEPYFYPKGSVYEFARSTYDFGFRGITAGDWLKEKLAKENGMITDSFGFSYDKTLYSPRPQSANEAKEKRIFFYARPYTPRRDFEIGVLAFQELLKEVPDVRIVFAGEDVAKYGLPFKHLNLGIVKVEELADIYASCDLCLVLSNTNLSLLPLEVMASGSVVVSSKGENNTWLLNEGNAILVDFEPQAIAKTIAYYLARPEEIEARRINGLAFAQKTSWETEGEKVKQAILRGLQEDENDII